MRSLCVPQATTTLGLWIETSSLSFLLHCGLWTANLFRHITRWLLLRTMGVEGSEHHLCRVVLMMCCLKYNFFLLVLISLLVTCTRITWIGCVCVVGCRSVVCARPQRGNVGDRWGGCPAATRFLWCSRIGDARIMGFSVWRHGGVFLFLDNRICWLKRKVLKIECFFSGDVHLMMLWCKVCKVLWLDTEKSESYYNRW